jgi:hypothetical protein
MTRSERKKLRMQAQEAIRSVSLAAVAASVNMSAARLRDFLDRTDLLGDQLLLSI